MIVLPVGSPFSYQLIPCEFALPFKASNRLLDTHDQVNSFHAICHINKSTESVALSVKIICHK